MDKQNTNPSRRDNLLPLLLLAGGAIGIFLFWLSRRQAPPHRITVATYNLQSHTDPDRIKRLIDTIRNLDADIVAVQELSEQAAAMMHSELKSVYSNMLLDPVADSPKKGQGIFSRYPISDGEYWQHTMGFQRVVIRIGQSRLNLFNAHPATPLTASYSQRAHEIDDLLQKASRVSGPVVLVGDFNMAQSSEDYERMTTDYIDSYAELDKSPRATFPAAIGDLPIISWFAKPAIRLDYVFHNADIRALDVEVLPKSRSSDHRPVRAKLLLNPPSE